MILERKKLLQILEWKDKVSGCYYCERRYYKLKLNRSIPYSNIHRTTARHIKVKPNKLHETNKL